MRLESFLIKIGLTKFYDNLDVLSQANWNKIIKTGTVSLLIKRGKATNRTLRTLWLKLQNEYLKTHGIHKEYANYLRLKLRYTKVGLKYLKTKDRNYLQEMRLLEMDFLGIESKFGGGMTFGEMYGWLVDRVNYLPLNKTSVNEYNFILNQAIKMHGNSN